MLYISAQNHSNRDLACLAPDYFLVMCRAIAELSIPSPTTELVADKPTFKSEENAFHDVLGIILAGLTCEASIKTTGIWISVGYRLILESCPKEVDERSREWQRLFAGLQVRSSFSTLVSKYVLTSPDHRPRARIFTHVMPHNSVASTSSSSSHFVRR
jgi:hypothetical protein